MRVIKHSQLAALLDAVAGVAFAGVEVLTDARVNKTCKVLEETKRHDWGKVTKRCKGVVTVGADYTAGVKREGDRQGVDAGEFKAQPLKWGHWLIPGKVITHKDKLYMRCQATPRQQDKPQMRVTGYVAASGVSLTYADIKPYLPAKKEAKTQQAYGLEETVMVRTYAFDSIRRIRINGITYTPVRDDADFASIIERIAENVLADRSQAIRQAFAEIAS